MADLGNVSVSVLRPALRWALPISRPVGYSPSVSPPSVKRPARAVGTYGTSRGTTGVVIDIPTSGRVSLMHAGYTARINVGVNGHTYFYDIDDGVYFAVLSGGISDGALGSAWRVEIVAGVVSVTPIIVQALPTVSLGARILVLDDGKIKAVIPG